MSTVTKAPGSALNLEISRLKPWKNAFGIILPLYLPQPLPVLGRIPSKDVLAPCGHVLVDKRVPEAALLGHGDGSADDVVAYLYCELVVRGVFPGD